MCSSEQFARITCKRLLETNRHIGDVVGTADVEVVDEIVDGVEDVVCAVDVEDDVCVEGVVAAVCVEVEFCECVEDVEFVVCVVDVEFVACVVDGEVVVCVVPFAESVVLCGTSSASGFRNTAAPMVMAAEAVVNKVNMEHDN